MRRQTWHILGWGREVGTMELLALGRAPRQGGGGSTLHADSEQQAVEAAAGVTSLNWIFVLLPFGFRCYYMVCACPRVPLVSCLKKLLVLSQRKLSTPLSPGRKNL